MTGSVLNSTVIQSEGGNPIIAVINTTLLTWDRQASHPWIAILTIEYDDRGNNGFPNAADSELINAIQVDITNELVDRNGYLNVGRQTSNNQREVYFACKDFRKPSKVFDQIQRTHDRRFKISYDIYKDKYWQTFQRFKSK
jgi:hypothetical protein